MRRAILIAVIAGALVLTGFLLLRTLAPPVSEPPPVTPEADRGPVVPPPDAEIDLDTPVDPGAIPRGAGAIHGVVREEASGAPVAGADVLTRLARWRGSARTGPTGEYRIEDVPAGSVQVRVRSSDLVDPPARFVRMGAGEVARLDFALGLGAAISGRVVDESTGAPVEGARVGLRGAARKTAVTDPDGSYRIIGVGIGSDILTAKAEDYPEVRVQISVAADARELAKDIALVRGATVHGLVVSVGGTPLEGALVDFGGDPNRRKTAEDGTFTLRGVPVTRSVWVRASLDGYVSARSKALRFRSGEEMRGLRLVLSVGGRVRGRVLLPDGRPAKNASVLLRRRGGGFVAQVPPVRTDGAGRFEISSVAAGDYEAVARLAGTLEARAELSGVEEGRVLEGVELRLKEGESIEGLVREESGRALSGVRVTARPENPGRGTRWGSAATDEEGNFRLTGLVPGAYRVSAVPRRGGGGAEVEGVGTGTTGLVLTLPAGGTLSGKVVLASGEPCVSYVLRIEPHDRSGGRRSIFERVAVEDGGFRLDGIPPGSYKVSASAPEEFSLPLERVEVIAGQDTAGLLLTLAPAASIRGRVLDQGGAAVAGARVSAASGGPSMSRGWSMARSDGEGLYEIPGLISGTYRVTATKDGRTAVAEGVVVAPAALVDVELVLPGEGRLVVRVVDGDGRPVAGASVLLRGAGGSWIPLRVPEVPEDVSPAERSQAMADARRRAVVTDDAGICVRAGVPAGEVRVTVRARGHADASASAEVRAGRSADVRIVLTAGVSSMDERERSRPSGGSGRIR